MTDNTDRRSDRIDQAGSGYVPIRPRLGMSDFLVQFWRSKWLILAITAPILAIGFICASNMPASFESRAVLYVASDTPGHSAYPLAQSEREILKTRLVAERTLSRFVLDRIYPGITAAQDRALAQTPERGTTIREAAFQKGVDAFQRAIRVTAVPESNIVNVRVVHQDPQVAAELLNAAIAVYLQRRAELFSDQPLDESTVERKTVEGQLLEAEDAIRVFLRENTIRDFDSERATAQGLHALISNELFAVEARQKAVGGQLRRIRTQLTETPKEQDLFVEDSTADRLRDLEIERNQALVTYLPDSQRVQTLETQIADLRTRLEIRDTLQGTVRRGPNPTYQALEVSRNSFEGEADSLAQKRAELARQLAAVEAKLERFTGLDAEWNALQRERDLLEAKVRITAGNDSGQSAETDPAAQVAGGVKIAEPATVLRTGRSAALPIFLLSVLTALFLAAVTALLRARSANGFATPSSLQRTTGLPVLAAIGRV
ncbi:MAG: Wzz/FepE/Etk N-terminal domain-containing protein [Hyphomonas sp.]|nr:Wzz/FepE/Etk N-terminal domain-containing protein [Hyphomonas sp.]